MVWRDHFTWGIERLRKTGGREGIGRLWRGGKGVGGGREKGRAVGV
jgi:hypothetical protein